MISNLQGNNIVDIGNLIFFTEKGYEIPTEKIYAISWELIPNSLVADNFISNPKGHFMFDITDLNKDIITVIDDPGKIIKSDVTIHRSDNKDIIIDTISADNVKDLILLNKTYTYNISVSHVKNRNTGKYIENYIEKTDVICNNIKLTFNLLTETIEKIYPINYIFNNVTVSSDIKNITAEDTEGLVYIQIEDLILEPIDNNKPTITSNTFINVLIEQNFGYERIFPCIRYMGNIMLDKVSTEFVAANTIIILEDLKNGKYKRPKFGNSEYKLHFEFQKNSEMKFISSDSIANIIWNDSYTVDMDNQVNGFDDILERKESPIYFSVGFTSEIEGCYQNIMAMYLKTSTTKHLLGLFTFLTTVEGEDERFRALLGNLGIPDPIKYPNIFKEQDPMEQGIDWTLVNNKSKELMINYDNIFPYVGTYKALLGAIRFLGYYDLIFKEWYKIKDLNNLDKYVTIQTYDLLKGISLKSKLKLVGITYGDFERYKKINRLTMIYHLNEIDDNTGETLTLYTKRTDLGHDITTSPDTGLYKAINPTTHKAEFGNLFYEKTSLFLQLPITYKIYEYRTDEILAKLYSVKLWLEKYILGANCYIADICGEGIIIERYKSLAYVTLHYVKDFTTAGKFTPKITHTTPFKQSESTITCSLNEFDSVTIGDYEDFTFEDFVKEVYKTLGGQTIYISAPFETPVVASEYQFELINKDSDSGTLAEFTDKNFITNPLLILDNKLLFFDSALNITKIQKSELPIIEITQGNLRYCKGNWKNNIAYSINVTVDLKTGREYFTMYDEETSTEFYRGVLKIFLYPYIKNEYFDKYKLYWTKSIDINETKPLFDGLESEMIYTTHTKWNVPMLIIRNYKCANNDEVIVGDFILEIIKGRILFRNHKKEINHGKAEGCEIKFGEEYESRELPITVDYKYLSEKVPIYTFDKSLLSPGFMTDDDITKCVSTNRYVDVSVNRLGTYSVSVLAFDNFNNIYVNNSDDYTVIKAKPIEIDTILNTEYMVNEKEFFDINKYGDKLSSTDVSQLLTDIQKEAAYPLYPLNYRIYDIDPVLDSSNIIEYDNISYAIDIPKPGNFIVFNNFTEKVIYIEKSGNDYKLKLLDENPNTETIINSSYVGLCIYDNLQKDIIADIYPLKVKELNIIESTRYLYDVNNSYIIVEKDSTTDEDADNSEITLDTLVKKCNDTSLLDSSSYFINSINAYIYCANEYIVEQSDIIVDYKNKLSYIYDDKQHYISDLVIKICYTNDEEIHNHYTKNSIDNEHVFKVIDVSHPDNNNYDTSIIYVLNGIIDLYKLNNKIYHNKAEHILDNTIGPLKTRIPYLIKMCPAHLRAALYILRINGFSEELTYMYNNSTVMKTLVQYAPIPLLFDSYLDTTYSALIYDYDPKLLLNIWVNINGIYKDTDNLYCYRDFPVTVNKGRILTMLPNKNLETLSTIFNDGNINSNIPLKVIWDWQSYVIEDESNWHSNLDLMGKLTIFKSANRILTIQPELLGTLSILMTCCDVYGNRLINPGDGFVYVNNNTYIVTLSETDTRDIYYKDVFIVGFESLFEPISTISMNGEIVTYSLMETGSFNKKENIQPIGIKYKIYYSDGTIETNEGADISLLNNNKTVKSNKIKKKFNKANKSHKFIVDKLLGQIKFKKTHKRDRLKEILQFEIDIKQYGTSITTSIYDLTYSVKNIPKEGIEKLNVDILSNYITDIKYTLERSEGEIETINADNIYDANLRISDFKYIDNKFGNINYINENKTDKTQYIGILQLTVEFYVNGVTDKILTKAFSNVYLL